MSSEFVQNILIKVREDGGVVIKKIGDDLAGLGQAARSSKGQVSEFGDAFSAIGGKLAVWVTGFLTLQKALEGVRAGMRQYDEAITLNAAISALTGSTKTAADTMAFFEKASAQTANTGTELARVFRDVLPMSMRAGLNIDQIKDMTVVFGQLAKSGLASTDALGGAFARLLTGHIRANELLLITGTRIEDITKGTDASFRKMAEKIVSTASEFSKIPDTFEIASKRVKDAMAEAFAAGMAGSSGTRIGIEQMKASLTDPKFLQAIRDMGQGFADLLPKIAAVVATLKEMTDPDLIKAWLILGPAGVAAQKGAEKVGGKVGTYLGFLGKPGAYPGMGGGVPPGGEEAGAIPEQFGPTMPEEIKQANRLVDTLTAGLKKAYEAWKQMQKEDKFVSDLAKASQGLADLGKNIQEQTKYFGGLQGAIEGNAQAIFDMVGEYMRLTHEFPKGWEYRYNEANKVLTQLEELKAADKAEGEAAKQAEEDRVRAIEAVSRALVNATGNAEDLSRALDRSFEMYAQRAQGVSGMDLDVVAQLRGLKDDAERRRQDAAEMGASPEALKRIEDTYRQASDRLLTSAIKGAEAWMNMLDKFEKFVVDPLVESLTDLLTTGGKNLGEIFSNALSQSTSAGIKEGLGALFEGLGPGVSYNAQTGMWQSGNKAYANQFGAQMGGALGSNLALGAGGLGIIAGMSGYYSRGQSDLSTVFQGSIMGLQMGGWLGAIIGAVAAGLGKLFQPSVGEGYSYGTPTISGARGSLDIYWRDVQNIPKAKLAQMDALIRKQFEDFWGGYVDILIKVGSKMIPKVSDFLYNATRGDVNKGTDFGNAASQSYWQHWDQWSSGTWPKEIAKVFYEPLEKAFMSFGGSAPRFKQLWDEWSQLEPKKALELWTDTFTALVSLAKSMKFFRTPFMPPQTFEGITGGFADPSSSLWNQTIAEKYQSWSDSVADINDRIFELGDAMKDMTSQQQVAAAKEIASLMAEKMQKEKELLRQILDMIEDANRTYNSFMEATSLATMSPQQQYEYWQRQVEFSRQRIASARTPAEAAQAWSDFMEDVNSLLQAGKAAGVDPAKLMKDAQDFVTQVHNEYLGVLRGFGNQIEAENAAFMARYQPIFDTWISNIDTSRSSLDDLTISATSADESLTTLTGAANSATQSLLDLAAAASAASTSGFSNYVRQSRRVQVA